MTETWTTQEVFADDVRIGDFIVHEGRHERVVGWFYDAKGFVILEHGGRFHVYRKSEHVNIRITRS